MTLAVTVSIGEVNPLSTFHPSPYSLDIYYLYHGGEGGTQKMAEQCSRDAWS